MPPLPTVEFLGHRLYSSTADRLIDWIVESAAERREPRRLGYLNAAQVNLSFDSIDFTKLLRKFDLLYADGKGVVCNI